MAIQRAAALPAPATEIQRARDTLARHYGGMVWDGPDRRILFVRVPRGDPDPVNDVEAAVEYLRPDDAKDITHCLLVGDDAVAQIYARPLQELMRQREQFDDRTAVAWRDRLAGTLAHVLFQSPEDPRRRWRLAVRIPTASVAELDERMLEELAEGIGPELDTSRMKQVCAVYLIASNDAVRLESDMFIEQMRAAWTDEDRRRRARLAEAQKRDAERRQKEAERRRIVAEMERRLVRDAGRRAPAPAMRQSMERADVEQRRGPPERLAPEPGVMPIAEATSTITARLRHDPSGPWATDVDDLTGILEAAQEQDGQQEAAVDKLDELRRRVDRVMDEAPQEPRPRHVQRTPRAAPEHRHERASIDRAISRFAGRGHAAGRPAAGSPAAAPSGRRKTPSAGHPTVAAPADRTPETRANDSTTAAVGGGPTVPMTGGGHAASTAGGGRTQTTAPNSGPVDPRSPRLAPARAVLETAGFDVIESPSTEHAIDLAGERPEGDPQRVVVRVVERLDQDVAKGLLKTARELDVDLVLCVADAVDPDGKRLLVATKIKVVAPTEFAQMPL